MKDEVASIVGHLEYNKYWFRIQFSYPARV